MVLDNTNMMVLSSWKQCGAKATVQLKLTERGKEFNIPACPACHTGLRNTDIIEVIEAKQITEDET